MFYDVTTSTLSEFFFSILKNNDSTCKPTKGHKFIFC